MVNEWWVPGAAAIPVAGDLIFFEPMWRIGAFLLFAFVLGFMVVLFKAAMSDLEEEDGD